MPRRLLVVLPNWFGETLFATPFLRAVRGAYPDGWIAAMGVPRAQEVLAHNPRVDARILYDEQGEHRSLPGKLQVIRRLRAERFDLAWVLRRSLTRTGLLLAGGIPARIGFGNAKSGWLLTERVGAVDGPVHKAATYLRLLEPLGLHASLGSYEYYVAEPEREEASRWWAREGLDRRRPVVVLHVGANWPHKQWPSERFAALANRLSDQGGSVVLTGGPEDRRVIEAILPRFAPRPVVLAGTTTLRQLAACLERADLVVANDTGVLHIASALGRPTVGLYGPTSPTITGPLGDPRRNLVVHHPDCCPYVPCRRPDDGHLGMSSISVEEVFAAAMTLLRREG